MWETGWGNLGNSQDTREISHRTVISVLKSRIIFGSRHSEGEVSGGGLYMGESGEVNRGISVVVSGTQ